MIHYLCTQKYSRCEHFLKNIMSITIIECNVDSITLLSFIKKKNTLQVVYESRQLLANAHNERITAEWLEMAIRAINVLVVEAKVLFPIIILLPGFPLLMKIIQVPKVVLSRQREVIQAHIHSIFGTGREEYLAYDVIHSGEFELEIICFFVKKQWIESFCRKLELLGLEIISIEPSPIQYYNFFKKEVKGSGSVLVALIQNMSLCYFFVNERLISIHQARGVSIFSSEELKSLIDLCNKKFPENRIREILVLGQDEDTGDFINVLKSGTGLQAKALSLTLHPGNLNSIGSAGAAHRELFGEGLRIDLIPPDMKKGWIFNRSKNAILFMGVCIAASCLIFLNNIYSRRICYEEGKRAYERKIIPLRKMAASIDRDEKEIELYNEGLGSLESYIKTNRSWFHIMNSLQSIFIKVPEIRIHALKIVDIENKTKSSWENELMKSRSHEMSIDLLRVMQITGSFAEADYIENGVIDKIKLLTSEFEKLEFVSEIKNLHFDSENLPKVSFSLSLALRPQVL